jgi:hypothetical protein
VSLIYDLKYKDWEVQMPKSVFKGRWAALDFDNPREAWRERLESNSVFVSHHRSKSLLVLY